MPKPKLVEHRFDFRGGYNDHTSPVLLQPDELPAMSNVTLDSQDGQLKMRLGTRRLHQTAFGAAVTGVYQWDGPSGSQLVAVANGDLWYRNVGAGDFAAFTAVSPTPAFGSDRASFATMRGSAEGAPLRLYVADGTNLWRHSGTAVTRLSGTSSIPDNVDLVEAYHIRNFLKSSDWEQHVFWTVLGDPEDGTIGARLQGGSAMVDYLRGEAVTAMTVTGSSLLIGTKNAIARFTGYDNQDIQIDQDTEGVDNVVGPLGKQCLVAMEKVAAMLSTTGVYAVSEKEAVLISRSWNTLFRSLDRDQMSGAVLHYHEGARELWVAVPGSGDGGVNRTVMIYHLDLQTWYGPYTYPFTITSLGRWDASDGTEHIVAGCADGYVRCLDWAASGLDDVLYDDSGGSAISSSVTFAPTFFDPGPGTLKNLDRMAAHVLSGTGETVSVYLARDTGAYVLEGTVGAEGASPSDSGPSRLDIDKEGDRFQVRMDWTDPDVLIRGFTLFGHDKQRPSG